MYLKRDRKRIDELHSELDHYCCLCDDAEKQVAYLTSNIHEYHRIIGKITTELISLEHKSLNKHLGCDYERNSKTGLV